MNPASVCFPVKIHPHGRCEKQFHCVNASGESNLNLTMFVFVFGKGRANERKKLRFAENFFARNIHTNAKEREMLTSPVRPVTPSWVVPILITSLN